jgi:hypothetical protein
VADLRAVAHLLSRPIPRSARRFQFWFFQYDSGQPVALSSLQLRDALSAVVAQLDPWGTDLALRRMVLIGHSQGGLLVKMRAIHSGDRIWNAVSRRPFAEVRLSDETRDLLRRGLFVEPLPEVSRVVFIATPHRGSFVAGRRIIANVVRKLVSLPFALTGVAADIARNPDAVEGPLVVPSAIDNMSPRHPFIRGLQTIPVAPSVTAHSIIAIEGKGLVARTVLLLVVIPLISAGTIFVDPAACAPPLATRIALSPEAPPIGRSAKRAGAQFGIGEGSQGHQSGRASHRGHDKPHERVDDGPGEEFAERSRISAIGPTEVLQVPRSVGLADDGRRISESDEEEVCHETSGSTVSI